jgi:branched-chain amino acid transport system substrate-binding protein
MFKTITPRRALLALALTAALPMASLAQGKDPVKVGLVSSKSGVWAEMGEEVIRGVRFAIDEVNAKGGIEGMKVEVSEGDDESTPDGGRRVAEKLARDGYNLLIGPIGSATSLAIMQNLDRWDAAYFATLSKSDKITGDTCKPRAFRTVQSDAMDMAMINAWAKNLKGNTFGVIGADYTWGRESTESFRKAAEALGKKVPLSLYAPMGTKDYSPYISQLKAAGVDAVWAAIPGRDGVAFMKQAGEFNLMPKTALLGHAMLSDFMLRATGKVQDGMAGTLGYASDIDTPRNKTFVAGFKAKFNRLPTETEGLGYHGATVMLEGARLAKSGKPADVSKALRGATVDTVFGPIQVRAADNQVMIPNFMGRAKWVDGGMRSTAEQTYGPSLIPAASALCKM